jgi:hypothetical protein
MSMWPRSKSALSSLAEQFLNVVPVYVRVQVSGTDSLGRAFAEQTALEYGSPTQVIFSSAIPLQTGDTVRITSLDGSIDITGTVAAAQYQHDKLAVAVRFASPMPDCGFKRR